MAISWPTDLRKLLKRISTPAEEVRDMLDLLGDYNKENIDAVETKIDTIDTVVDAVKVVTDKLETLKGTAFAVKIAITDKTTIVTAGLLLTAASTGGELILKRVTLQNDGTVTGGNTGGALIYSDDATYPLNVELTNGVFAADTFYAVDIGYPIQTGKKVGIKAVTGNCTGAGSLVITLVFVRNADGASIAAA